jgi:hypothetical protein
MTGIFETIDDLYQRKDELKSSRLGDGVPEESA